MAYEVTATRKRPQRFDALKGQDFVKATITSAIENKAIAHAYLFSGPRGVGKTTSARLLAKALNCVNGPTPTPCNECANCIEITKGCSLDVIEIDGASNTSVDDIRKIKDEVQFPPQNSKYKIYIIDEVHMLSKNAFNALLKTIEEPPEYVIFIFATTETNKVPETIRSRCQQFNFQLLPFDTIKTLLKEAADEMKVESEDAALFWIAKESTGSMRDAYTLFDQVVAFSNGHITLDQIKDKLGLTGTDSLNVIMEYVINEDGKNALLSTQDLLNRGVSIEQLIKDFAQYFRSLLLLDNGIENETILGEKKAAFSKKVIAAFSKSQKEEALNQFLNLYRDIRYSINQKFELELEISKLCSLKYYSTPSLVAEQIARLKNDLINGKITPLDPVYKDVKDIAPTKYKTNITPSISNTSAIKPEVVDKKVEPIIEKKVESEIKKSKPVAEVSQKLVTLDLRSLTACVAKNLPNLNIAIKQTKELEETDNFIILYYKSEFSQKRVETYEKELRALIVKYFNCEKPLKFVNDDKKSKETTTVNLDETDKRIVKILGGQIK